MKTATVVFTVALAVASSAVAETGRELIDLSGVRGGLVVHVGCGDGERTEQLAAGPAHRVHGLDRDPERVAAARQRLKAAGLYGPVAADLWEGRHLPYIENLVNLLVVERGSDLSEAEMMRVLVPYGVALVAGANGWEKRVKPRPDAMDEWTLLRRHESLRIRTQARLLPLDHAPEASPLVGLQEPRGPAL